MKQKQRLMNLLLVLILLGGLSSACSTLKVNYPVYVLRVKEGKLNAHEEKDDLPLSVCDDTAQSKANCYVILRGDYIRLMRDLATSTGSSKN